MIVALFDTTAGTTVYINPAHVVSVRPDPADPDHNSILKLRDGEAVYVRGGHEEIAGKLTRSAA